MLHLTLLIVLNYNANFEIKSEAKTFLTQGCVVGC